MQQRPDEPYWDSPEWDENDRDAPQARDLTDEDADETPTVPCPHCGREIPDFADRCPYCGDWIVQSSGPPAHRTLWFTLFVVVAILLILVFWLR
jgi:DNA-directed RNA polymerase subunit RPC12/RpoP